MSAFDDSVILGRFPATLLLDTETVTGEGSAYSVLRG